MVNAGCWLTTALQSQLERSAQGNTACRKANGLMPMGLGLSPGFGDLQHRGSPSIPTPGCWGNDRARRKGELPGPQHKRDHDCITESAAETWSADFAIRARLIAAGKIAWRIGRGPAGGASISSGTSQIPAPSPQLIQSVVGTLALQQAGGPAVRGPHHPQKAPSQWRGLR